MVGTSGGVVKMIDVDSNRILWKDELHRNEIIFDLDVNSTGVIAISLRATIQFKKYDTRTGLVSNLRALTAPDLVRSLSFSLLNPT